MYLLSIWNTLESCSSNCLLNNKTKLVNIVAPSSMPIFELKIDNNAAYSA
jgi:hypothetical protein